MKQDLSVMGVKLDSYIENLDAQKSYTFKNIKLLEKELVRICKAVDLGESQLRYDKCHSSRGTVRCCVPDPDFERTQVLGPNTTYTMATGIVTLTPLDGHEYDYWVWH